MISPRYLYLGTSSSTSPFSVRALFFPFPLNHFAFCCSELDMVFVCHMVGNI